jgi:CheY-like chemotaxis protein
MLIITLGYQMQRARKAAEAVLRAKNIFIANVSHDLRTPLTAILGMAELLLDHDRLSPQASSQVKTIKRAGDMLLMLLNDIIDIVRTESGKIRLNNERFNVRDVIKISLRALGVLANSKRLYVQQDVDDNVPTELIGDPLRLRQIMMNLIGNSIKFTEIGGVTVRIRLESQHADTATLQFEVIDTGMGVSPEDQARIFAPFVQIHTGVKQIGVGLGLSIASTLVKLMGGKLHIRSNLGEGSTFYFTANFGLPTTPSPVESPPHEVSVRALHILLAEDTMSTQKIICLMLKKRGHHVVAVSNGQEAVERAHRDQFDLILMDVLMPVMDGLKATQLIRKENSRIPIIAITAHAMQEDERRCLEVGMNGFTTKPIDSRHLFNLINKFTSN